MRYLSIYEVLEIHERVLASSGGGAGIRDLGGLESAVNQPYASFGGADLYPDLPAKAAAMYFSLVMNHPFVDGNKRTGHAAMETFLLLNGLEICAGIDEQEKVMVNLATGQIGRKDFISWLGTHTTAA